ncbi:hypothetical protein U1Q18_049123, partial [Sarracenia purpurea var. burkii]
YEIHHKTHNSGVVVKGEHDGKDIEFYGVLDDIIELHYTGGNQDMKLGNDWHIVERNKPRNTYDVPQKEDEEFSNDDEPYQQDESHLIYEPLQIDDEVVHLERDEFFPEVRVDANSVPSIEKDNIINNNDVDEEFSNSDDDMNEHDLHIEEDSHSD